MADALLPVTKYGFQSRNRPATLIDCSIVPSQARIMLLMEYEYMRKEALFSAIDLHSS